MSKEKRITVDQLCALNNNPIKKTIMWHGIAVTVRTLLSPKEVISFVNNVMENCFNENQNICVPELKDFAFRLNAVSRYAYVDMPDDIEEQYSILYNTDIFETIMSAVNTAQIESIKESIDILIKRCV